MVSHEKCNNVPWLGEGWMDLYCARHSCRVLIIERGKGRKDVREACERGVPMGSFEKAACLLQRGREGTVARREPGEQEEEGGEERMLDNSKGERERERERRPTATDVKATARDLRARTPGGIFYLNLPQSFQIVGT